MTPDPTREAAARLEALIAVMPPKPTWYWNGNINAQAADLRAVLTALSDAQGALTASRVKIAEIIDPNYFAKYSTAPKAGQWVFNDSYGERGRNEALAKADAILALREKLTNA